MAGNIFDWSKTAASNSTADGDVNWAEGQAPSTVNNSARQVMGRVAELLDDLGGVTATTNSGDAFTLTANSTITAFADGHIVGFKANASNTGAATLNVNALGAKAIRYQAATGDAALRANMLRANGKYVVVYSTAANGGAGAWVLAAPSVTFATPTNQSFTSGSGTYTTPTGATWIRVRMVGGGGGGGQSGSGGTPGTVGGNTTFSTATAGGGGGGSPLGAGGGGTASGGTVNLTGGAGQEGNPGAANFSGGNGGASAFGGAGRGVSGSNGGVGAANTGGGGGGAGVNTTAFTGGGGGSGGYVEFYIANPNATYSYAVGAAGTGGTGGGQFTGGNGGSGIIIVEEHYT